MTHQLKRIFFIVLAITTLVTANSCKKDRIDEPPIDVTDPNLPVNSTIAELKAGFALGTLKTIQDDITIAGIVIANDRTGNFYKQIVIQDETGGIAINIERSNLYGDYPIGRKVYVKCKGLILSDYRGLIQLTGSKDTTVSPVATAGILSQVLSKVIIKGPMNQPIDTLKLSIDQLDPFAHQNCLVQLSNVEFISSDVNQLYANAATLTDVNRTVKDCDGRTVLVRTSAYSSIANARTPSGNGTLTAVYTIFQSGSRTDNQFYLRDTSDVAFTGERCTLPGNLMSIADLRAVGTGSAPANTKIKGIVISDRVANNEQAQNVVLQDGTAGIVVRFTSAHSFNQGDEIEVNVQGVSLSLFSGVLQVGNIDLGKTLKTGTGTVTPRVTTIPDLIANYAAWESTLIKIEDVTLSGGTGGTYSGNVTMTDGSSNTMILRTGTSATYAGTAYPTGTVDVVSYVYPFNSTKQVKMRNTADVQ